MSENKNQQIVIYETDAGAANLRVHMQNDTVWLSQQQMAELFNSDRTNITKHIANIFKEGELDKNSVCEDFAHTAADGKNYKTKFYNLDVIISVGYRVKSVHGTQFRIWATRTLREFLVRGLIADQQRIGELREKGLTDLSQTVTLIQKTISQNKLSNDEAHGLLDVITKYTDSWLLLQRYDDGDLELPTRLTKPNFVMTTDYATNAIAELKTILAKNSQASDLFGASRSHGIDAIIGAIYQSFGGADLYKSTAEKAANLLYLTIKDHPFRDGNKRIASFLFVVFITMNKYGFRKNGEAKISDRTLVALALLIAQSKPNEKEIMIALICNLLKD